MDVNLQMEEMKSAGDLHRMQVTFMFKLVLFMASFNIQTT